MPEGGAHSPAPQRTPGRLIPPASLQGWVAGLVGRRGLHSRAPGRTHSLSAGGSRADGGSLSTKAAAPHCRGRCGPPIRRAPLALPLSRPTDDRSHPAKLQAGRCPVHQHHLGAVRVAGAAQERLRSAPWASMGHCVALSKSLLHPYGLS